MKRIDKILMAMIIAVLTWWGICYAYNPEDDTPIAAPTDDMRFYIVTDPNGAGAGAAAATIPWEELIAGYTQLTDKASLESAISDVSDFAEADGDIYTGVHDFGGATSLEIPNDESADATLTALGQVHIRGDEDRYSMHFGAGGEIAGEATMSGLHKISCSFDPGSWYDSSPYVNLGPILAKQYPNGIIIDYWEVTCHLDPDVEMTMNLCYSVNSFDLADPNIIDVMDTTNGLSSEDTDASINGGAAIPAGVYLYLMLGADLEGTCVLLIPTILYHGEED